MRAMKLKVFGGFLVLMSAISPDISAQSTDKGAAINAETAYPAGKTPAAAWQTLLSSWKKKVRDPNLGVYTDVTKLIYRDYQDWPDGWHEEEYAKWGKNKFQVRQDPSNRYAVIYFSDKPGWENAPFLFCRTEQGWQWDVVSQRKFVRFGPAPAWGVERTDEPYADLLLHGPYYMGVDMPLPNEDIFQAEDDLVIARRILELEQARRDRPDDFEVVMELARLNTIASRGPQHTFMLLEQAKKLNPQNPLPYKYLAIRYVDSSYQYQPAMEAIREYIVRAVDDPFGYNFLGYLYYQLGQFDQAIGEFKKALQFDRNNLYAHEKLSRCYAELFVRTPGQDSRGKGYQQQSWEMFLKAQSLGGQDNRRVIWLREWLAQWGAPPGGKR